MFKIFNLKNKPKTKFRLFSESDAGYTILELLVVVAIISVLSVMIISNFPQTKLQFSLSRVTNEFEQDLRRAQELSLSSTEFKDSNGIGHPAKGYGVYIDASNNKKYIIYADILNPLESNQQYDPGIDYVVETNDFSLTEPGIIIKDVSNMDINFNPPIPVTTLHPGFGSSSLDVVFALESNLAKTKTVSINTVGLVEIK